MDEHVIEKSGGEDQAAAHAGDAARLGGDRPAAENRQAVAVVKTARNVRIASADHREIPFEDSFADFPPQVEGGFVHKIGTQLVERRCRGDQLGIRSDHHLGIVAEAVDHLPGIDLGDRHRNRRRRALGAAHRRVEGGLEGRGGLAGNGGPWAVFGRFGSRLGQRLRKNPGGQQKGDCHEALREKRPPRGIRREALGGGIHARSQGTGRIGVKSCTCSSTPLARR